ncbi:VOC family protein [Paenibacillus tarimensis]
MIKGYSVVFLPSRNIEESKTWYQTHLDLVWDQWVMKVPNGAPIFFVESEDTWNFMDEKGEPCAVLSFVVEDADKLHTDLKQAKVVLEDTVRTIPGIGKEFWFHDPSGNRLLVTEPE